MENRNIDTSAYEVVRKEFLGDADVPQLTFSKGRFHVNSYCLKQFPNDDYVLVLVKQDTKEVILLPKRKAIRNSVRWVAQKKRMPRKIGADPLYYLIFKLMQWDFRMRYRIDGEIIENKDEKLLYFSLQDAVCFERNEEDLNHPIQRVPEIWKNRFGIPKKDYDEAEYVKTYEEDALFEVELPFRRELADKMKGIGTEQEVKTNE